MPYVLIFMGLSAIGIGVAQIVKNPKSQEKKDSAVPAFQPKKKADEELTGS